VHTLNYLTETLDILYDYSFSGIYIIWIGTKPDPHNLKNTVHFIKFIWVKQQLSYSVKFIVSAS